MSSINIGSIVECKHSVNFGELHIGKTYEVKDIVYPLGLGIPEYVVENNKGELKPYLFLCFTE